MTRTEQTRGDTGVVLIVGAGPGVGVATARRFGRDGSPVALIARDAKTLNKRVQGLREDGIHAAGFAADATDFDQLRKAVIRVVAELGPVATLCFSPLPRTDLIKPVRESTAEDFAAALALSVGGAAAAVQAVLPAMIEAGNGRLLFITGSGALRPTPERAVSAIQTTAEEAYIRLLAADLHQTGAKVAHLTVVGAIGPGALHEPDTVADALWNLACGDAAAAILDNATSATAKAAKIRDDQSQRPQDQACR